MTTPLFALVLSLAAAPKPLVWKLEDARKIAATNAPRELDFRVTPHLEATELQISLSGEDRPNKAKVTVLKGPGLLKGKRFMLENNYGRAMLSEALVGEAPRDLPALEAAVGTLFEADPIVAAGTGCDEKTGEAIAQAAARLTARISMAHPEEYEVLDARGSCAKAKNTYAVSFTLKGALRDERFTIPYSGTVTVPPGAARASFNLVGSVAIRLQKETKKPVRIDGTLVLKSTFSAK